MISRLRVKYGEIEIDLEVEKSIGTADIFEILEKVSELAKPFAPSQKITTPEALGSLSGIGADMSGYTTSDFASKLTANSGPDLVRAAAAALHFNGKSEFTKSELTASMREAKHFFKPSYINNQGSILERLVKKGVLRLLGADRYSLSNVAIEELKKQFAQP